MLRCPLCWSLQVFWTMCESCLSARAWWFGKQSWPFQNTNNLKAFFLSYTVSLLPPPHRQRLFHHQPLPNRYVGNVGLNSLGLWNNNYCHSLCCTILLTTTQPLQLWIIILTTYYVQVIYNITSDKSLLNFYDIKLYN